MNVASPHGGTAEHRPTPTPALEVRSVVKRFDDTVAVDGVDLTVTDEIVALVGPSGCGKSTLLRLTAGLEHADDGTITLAGNVVDGPALARDGTGGRSGRGRLRPTAPEHRGVGLVFQEHALFPHLSVERNVAFGLDRSDRPSERVAEMLELVGLGHHGRRYPHELSGGERQRVALARALAPRPTLLLLDEPFASLDPNLRARIRHDIVEILRATATPTVFVTHDQNEALAAGDIVAVMKGGRIAQVGSAEAVYHSPVNEFVAAFMGEADFLGTSDITALGADPTDLADAGSAMVRPDDITFVADDSGGAVITRAEFRGSLWCYTLQLDSGATIRSARSHLDRVEVGAVVRPAMAPGHRPVPIAAD